MAAMSPLRRRMIEDITVRNRRRRRSDPKSAPVAKFSRHFGRSPDRLDLEDVRTFQVHLGSLGQRHLVAGAEPDRCAPCGSVTA